MSIDNVVVVVVVIRRMFSPSTDFRQFLISSTIEELLE
jgi:hypothetical protein